MLVASCPTGRILTIFDDGLHELSLGKQRSLYEMVKQFIGFGIDDTQLGAHRRISDRFRDVTLAGAGRTNNILPINILPKSPSNTAFTRAMANG